jgi:hypothetical protein
VASEVFRRKRVMPVKMPRMITTGLLHPSGGRKRCRNLPGLFIAGYLLSSGTKKARADAAREGKSHQY